MPSRLSDRMKKGPFFEKSSLLSLLTVVYPQNSPENRRHYNRLKTYIANIVNRAYRYQNPYAIDATVEWFEDQPLSVFEDPRIRHASAKQLHYSTEERQEQIFDLIDKARDIAWQDIEDPYKEN